MRRYFSLYEKEKEADIYIYGDIVSYPNNDSDCSSYNLSQELKELDNLDKINVYISSYGGEVKEGLAIYNALRRHKAKIITYTDSLACSIASVVFTAGDERVMSEASLLMIHNAWMYTAGDSNELRKKAEDLDKITQLSINAYMNVMNISEDDLKQLLDEETWITAESAVYLGLATTIKIDSNQQKNAQNVRASIAKRVTKQDSHKIKASISNSGIKKETRSRILKIMENVFDSIN